MPPRAAQAAAPSARLRVLRVDQFRSSTNSGPSISRGRVARDGRFLGLVINRNDYQLVIVPNWLPELKRRMAGAR